MNGPVSTSGSGFGDDLPTEAYLGPAAVVTGSGVVPVEAELLIRHVPSGGAGPSTWSGRLAAAPDAELLAIATGPCTLRLPDGRVGTFTPGAVAMGSGVLPVSGRGLGPPAAG